MGLHCRFGIEMKTSEQSFELDDSDMQDILTSINEVWDQFFIDISLEFPKNMMIH